MVDLIGLLNQLTLPVITFIIIIYIIIFLVLQVKNLKNTSKQPKTQVWSSPEAIKQYPSLAVYSDANDIQEIRKAVIEPKVEAKKFDNRLVFPEPPKMPEVKLPEFEVPEIDKNLIDDDE